MMKTGALFRISTMLRYSSLPHSACFGYLKTISWRVATSYEDTHITSDDTIHNPYTRTIGVFEVLFKIMDTCNFATPRLNLFWGVVRTSRKLVVRPDYTLRPGLLDRKATYFENRLIKRSPQSSTQKYLHRF
jgi:hypothetical protein